MNAFLADLDLKKTENTVLATFNLSFDSILDCSSYKIEKLFTKELPIPQYAVDEFEGNLDGASNGKGANSKGKNGDKNDKKNKQPVKNEPIGKGILRFYQFEILINNFLKILGKDKKKSGADSSLKTEEDAVLKPKILELNLKFEVNQFQNFEDYRNCLNSSNHD